MNIIICCPGNTPSGGPELMHQLCDVLISKRIECGIFYYGTKENRRTHDHFKKYNIRVIEKLPFGTQNCIIVPEIRTDLLKKVDYEVKIIWWQSVDNYWKYLLGESRIKKLLGISFLSPTELVSMELVFHACQSFYAFNFLHSIGIRKNRMMLQDYINEDFVQLNFGSREDIILYNPKKGYDLLKKIMNHNNSLKFIPITGMNRGEMLQVLNKSKIYLDLGSHPGMDRIPREAAICGCVCLFADQGSVSNGRDVPVSDFYKVDLRGSFEKYCCEKIKDVLENYIHHYNNQSEYRKIISKQKELFVEQVENLVQVISIKNESI